MSASKEARVLGVAINVQLSEAQKLFFHAGLLRHKRSMVSDPEEAERLDIAVRNAETIAKALRDGARA